MGYLTLGCVELRIGMWQGLGELDSTDHGIAESLGRWRDDCKMRIACWLDLIHEAN